MIRGLDFVSYPTRDLARAIAFYRDVLGLELHAHTPGRFAEFEVADGATICLYPGDAFGEDFVPTTGPAFRVDDVAGTVAHLMSKGVSFPDASNLHDSGFCHSAIFLDSEGNRLFLHHRYQPEERLER